MATKSKTDQQNKSETTAATESMKSSVD